MTIDHTYQPVLAGIDAVGVTERCQRFCARSIKQSAKIEALRLALSMLDLTTLEGQDTPGKVTCLCAKARHLHAGLEDLPQVAAVCVYPAQIRVAVEALAGSGIRVASVATAFPSGQTSLPLRLEEIRYAVEEGADEIDMVISRGAYLRGEYGRVHDEIAAARDTAGSACLKVILETGELSSLDQVRHVSHLAMNAGAGFIKTSTGKVQPAATMPVTLVMLQAIQDHYRETHRRVGMKPAGGIARAKQAIQYLVMVRETLGPAWLTPSLFRFGASRLANDLLMQLTKQHTGAYPSLDYFSQD